MAQIGAGCSRGVIVPHSRPSWHASSYFLIALLFFFLLVALSDLISPAQLRDFFTVSYCRTVNRLRTTTVVRTSQ